MTRICKRCARPFEGYKTAVYCQECKETKRVFVGIDGEGETFSDGTTNYTTLSVGNRTISSIYGLSHVEVFEFLWKCFKEDRDNAPQGMSIVYVGFFLKYDFTQWIKGMSVELAESLFTKEGQRERGGFRNQTYIRPATYKANGIAWKLDFTYGMKQMKLGRHDESGIMYINDCGPLFSESFLKVIEPSRWDAGFITQAEYDIIAAGKEARGTDFDGLIEYNLLENELLARVLTEYDKGFRSLGLNIRSSEWYGPGPVAQSWLNDIDAPIVKSIPDYVEEAAKQSYYAGWMEIYNHGHVNDVYSYDINSAYPHVIASLPCLECGFWVAEEQGDYVLMNCYVAGSNDEMGPLLKRLGDSGMLTRPKDTIGWYWKHEVDAAERAGLVESIEVEECYSYIPVDCGHKPFAQVADLYDKRLGSGKTMRNVYKVVCNSVYGKLAQKEGKYSNWVYASLITAGCRTQILDAIASHPMGAQDVVMVATDAVYFRSRHESLPKSNRLGDWKETHWDRITLFLPGMYWGDCDGNEGLKVKSRGVSEKAFAKVTKSIDRAFKVSAAFNRIPDAKFTVQVDFDMVTPQQALRMGHWDLAGTVNATTREFSLKKVNKKRDLSNVYKDRGVLRSSIKTDISETMESSGYSDRFRSLIQEGIEETKITAKDWEGSGIGC